MDFTPGQRIKAPFLSAPAIVKAFEPRSGYYRLEIVLQDASHTYQTLRITDQQLAQIQLDGQLGLRQVDNPEDLFLLIEAHRLRLAYQFDPQLAVSVSQVDPLPHQIEAVYHYVLPNPRVRFLIADDPGAGKTIMAGLILKELIYRHLVRRVLIVVPGHLKYQWQREMKEKFGLSFAIIDRGMINAAWAENVWQERDDCITSIDFIKQEEIRQSLRSVRWDLVIVDEAHKMSAYAYIGRDRTKIDKTQRYRAGEILSQQTEHMLFLTATPHRGDEENFRLFLDLLRPGFFARPDLLKESIVKGDNPIFIRRLKEDMLTFDGKKIFPPRHVQTISFRLTPEELALYNEVTHYVRDYFDRAKENRSISFALMILQRRLTSSAHAIYRSLQRRKGRMEELLELPDKIREEREDYMRARSLTAEEIEDLPEEDRALIEERISHLTIAQNIDDVKAEIEQLDGLIARAQVVLGQEIESKLVGLRDNVLTHLNGRKLLIFTEFKDTLNYLAGDGKQGRPLGKLHEWGYDVITIDGSMGMDARIAAEHAFRDRAQILVATEAAGEGINLQFCSLMVNYDIPWNPNRLEQRMGRIHRYGQDREVFVWNMIAQDTREGQILLRLFEKLNKMREALGDRVFDIIGEILPGTRLDELLRDAIFSQRRMEEIEGFIEAVDEVSLRRTLEEVFLTGLATRHIDYAALRRESLEAEENRLVPEYVGDYFRRAMRRLGGSVKPRGELFTVDSVPYDVRRWSEDYGFKTTYGQIFREYRHITFDKRLARAHPQAEFVAPGHPLLEAVNETILAEFDGGQEAYGLYGDPQGRYQGVLWFLEGAVEDGTGRPAGKRVFCLYHAADGGIRAIHPAILWDLEPLIESDLAPELLALLQGQADVADHAIVEVLFPYRTEIAERREHEAEIKARYGLRSLDYLIQEANQKILDYQLRQASGENLDLPLLNEQRNLDALRARREGLEEEIRLDRHLTVGEPRFLGAAVVMPMPASGEITYPEGGKTPVEIGMREKPDVPYTTGGGMARDERAEAVGMQVAMARERDRGWQPEDVSAENLGFDVRSICYDEDGTFTDVRYIEVKARARSGAIRLSSNEWKKARHFGEKFWLYIVTEAGTDQPELHHIQDPSAQFQEGEDIFATGFIVQEETWRERTRND
ncbi:MAG: helicase-related protein [Chloroflexota bacterium]